MYCTGKASDWFFRHEMSDLLFFLLQSSGDWVPGLFSIIEWVSGLFSVWFLLQSSGDLLSGSFSIIEWVPGLFLIIIVWVYLSIIYVLFRSMPLALCSSNLLETSLVFASVIRRLAVWLVFNYRVGAWLVFNYYSVGVLL